ncbi:MAG: hypothetical protein KBF57_01805 [Saprospiraceae bacterium]|nr:hypothetical protein [Saprospiraceae bacterium]
MMWVLMLTTLLACSNQQKKEGTATSSVPDNATSNFLSMKINGQLWEADHDVIGAFHPKGYDQLIIIGGSSGKKDKSENSFTVNIYKTNGPGKYNFVQGNPALSVAQMGNWSEEEYLCGSMMGFDVSFDVTKASKNPTIVEATFSGKLTCPSGKELLITEGKFYYEE